MNLDRLSRITDLFQEGREMVFGEDDTGPIIVWVNKLNSFEEEEARRDGAAARSLRVLALGDDSPEVRAAQSELGELTRSELVEIIAAQGFEEDYLLAIDDVESDKDWTEKLSAMRTIFLIDDAELGTEDPRRQQAIDLNSEYMVEVNKRAAKRQTDRQVEASDKSLDELFALFVQNWKGREGLSEFFAEQRVTQIFYALRDCQGTIKNDEKTYDHTRCTHKRLLEDRSQVRSLPQEVLEQVLAVLSDITVDRRTAGNLGVPASSSESSEHPKQEEESTPSIPKVMRPGAQAI